MLSFTVLVSFLKVVFMERGLFKGFLFFLFVFLLFIFFVNIMIKIFCHASCGAGNVLGLLYQPLCPSPSPPPLLSWMKMTC